MKVSHFLFNHSTSHQKTIIYISNICVAINWLFNHSDDHMTLKTSIVAPLSHVDGLIWSLKSQPIEVGCMNPFSPSNFFKGIMLRDIQLIVSPPPKTISSFLDYDPLLYRLENVAPRMQLCMLTVIVVFQMIG